jgi:hypothetical protein
MSDAPTVCAYCQGDDPNCGFCDNGKPLDTQEDWDNSWGRILERSVRTTVTPSCQTGVCPNETRGT